jgi:branched-chain amino acid transport system ATP-binding protein
MIGAALATEPTLLLLDEPFAGLNAEESAELVDIIRKLRDEIGLSILLIDHNLDAVMSVCDRIIVMHLGKKIAEGKPEKVQLDKNVIEIYLGGV